MQQAIDNTQAFVSVQDLIYVQPFLFLLCAAVLPIGFKLFKNNQEPSVSVSTFLCAPWVLAMGVFMCALWPRVMGGSGAKVFLFSKALVFDAFSASACVTLCLMLFMALFLWRDSADFKGPRYSESLFLLMGAGLGMLQVAWANDLIVMFIGIELMSLCLYMLMAVGHGRAATPEAFKYFVLGSVASAIFLYGLSFVHGVLGTTLLSELSDGALWSMLNYSRLVLVGVLLMGVGLAFKVGLVPFASWVPDVYQGAPTPLTAFMSAGVKLVVFVAFLRLILTGVLSHEKAHVLVSMLQWVAVLSILGGNIMACLQQSLKRVLAYSSIAHAGYALVGVVAAAGVGGGSVFVGTSTLVFYVFVYAVMSMGAFGVVAYLQNEWGFEPRVADLKALAYSKPWVAGAFGLLLLSLAGVPPLVGFWAKFLVLTAAMGQGMFWLVFWAIIGSVVGVYYYLRPIVCMYMYEQPEPGAPALAVLRHGGLGTLGVLCAGAFFVVVFGVGVQMLYAVLAL